MVEIPSGAILLRDDRKKTQWSVRVEPFYLSRYQASQELYYEVTRRTPASFQGKQRPVEEVSWYDAVNFCNLLSRQVGLQQCYVIESEAVSLLSNANGYRLPTDAEWEYACRAGDKRPRYGELDAIAWYKDNSQDTTHDVGLKVANDWGLYDMLGNVWSGAGISMTPRFMALTEFFGGAAGLILKEAALHPIVAVAIQPLQSMTLDFVLPDQSPSADDNLQGDRLLRGKGENVGGNEDESASQILAFELTTYVTFSGTEVPT